MFKDPERKAERLGEIPLGRLKAMPFARHCVKCKSDLEKLQAQTKRFEEERAYREIPLGAEEEDA